MKKPALFTVSRTVHTDLNGALQKLKRKAIYVGIPRGSREDAREDEAISNSDLGWIHEKGAPAAGIPPRPFLEPGVQSVKAQVTDRMSKAMKAALSDDESVMEKHLEAAAMEAESAVKKYLSEGNVAPLKPSTIKNRRHSRDTKSKRPGEKDGTASVVPLINTGALRDAITGFTVEE